jgi:hypothetical protein
LDYITQTKDGTIGLNFQPYRKSCSRAPTSYNEIIDKPVSPPRYNLSQLETNLQGINKGKFVDTHFYSVASATSISETNNPLRNYNEINNPNSPTQSQMEDPQIMIITREYEINKEKLRKDFMSLEYDHKRTWFFKTFSQIEQNHMRTK